MFAEESGYQDIKPMELTKIGIGSTKYISCVPVLMLSIPDVCLLQNVDL